jgi:hypothetical protein
VLVDLIWLCGRQGACGPPTQDVAALKQLGKDASPHGVWANKGCATGRCLRNVGQGSGLPAEGRFQKLSSSPRALTFAGEVTTTRR